MKVLLVGEFSGFHTNLKDGLTQLGIETDIAGSGDGFKKIYVDINIITKYKGIKRKIWKYILPLIKIKKMINYDIVQFINPYIFTNKIFLNKFIYIKLIKNNKKTFLVATGTDAMFWQIGEKHLRKYNSLEDYKKIDLNNKTSLFEKEKALKWNIELAEKMYGIIPSMFEYSLGYNEFKNVCPIIPQPINTKKFIYKENKPKKKIKILHGISRPGFKGSQYILEAMNKINAVYPDKVEIIVVNKLPFNEYIKRVYESNIVIDQTNSYSYGMNALIAMAMGRVVLSGAEPEALKAMGVSGVPVINIKPDSNQIYKKISFFIENENIIYDTGQKSRLYVEKYHDSIRIAKKYLKIWKQ